MFNVAASLLIASSLRVGLLVVFLSQTEISILYFLLPMSEINQKKKKKEFIHKGRDGVFSEY